MIIALLNLWETVKGVFAIPDQRLPHLGPSVEAMFTRAQGGSGPLLPARMLDVAWAAFRVACSGFVAGGRLPLRARRPGRTPGWARGREA